MRKSFWFQASILLAGTAVLGVPGSAYADHYPAADFTSSASSGTWTECTHSVEADHIYFRGTSSTSGNCNLYAQGLADTLNVGNPGNDAVIFVDAHIVRGAGDFNVTWLHHNSGGSISASSGKIINASGKTLPNEIVQYHWQSQFSGDRPDWGIRGVNDAAGSFEMRIYRVLRWDGTASEWHDLLKFDGYPATAGINVSLETDFLEAQAQQNLWNGIFLFFLVMLAVVWLMRKH